MPINLYYEYASILISILLFIYYGTTKKVNNFHNKVFMALIVVNVLTALFDVANKWLVYLGGEYDLIRLTTMGYFVTHLLILPMVFFYILTNIKSWYEISTRYKVLVISPILVSFIALLSNPYTHFMYYYDLDGTYHKSSGYILLYLVVALYLLLMVYMLYRFKNFFSILLRVVFAIEMVIFIASMLIQSAFYNVRLETFGITYCLLLMFFAFQNPKDQVDTETGLYNDKAFYTVMHRNIATKRYFNLIEIIVTGFENVYVSNSGDRRNSIAVLMADYLRNLNSDNLFYGSIDVYRVKEDLFCLEIVDMPEEDIIRLIRTIRKRFTMPWNHNGYEILYNIKMCHIAIPEEIDSMAKLTGIINGSAGINEDKELLSVSDFDLGKLERQTGLNASISKALEEDRIEIVFSPACNVLDKRIVAADTTIRIFEKEVGYVNEKEIFEFAEKNGKIGSLSKQQIDKLCKFISTNNPKDLGLELIGMELSAAMCHQAGYIDYLIEVIEKNKIDPSIICFKISEYTVHKAPELIKEIMDRLHKYGFKFCLNDYGSGFTNLASIYELSFDMIEISKNVVKEALSNSKAKITLESTIELAKDLGMITLAGGIEDENYFDLILKAGCQYAMGDYFLVNISEKDLVNILVTQENMIASIGINRSANFDVTVKLNNDNAKISNVESNNSSENNENGGIA